MTQITVKDASGANQTIEAPNANGRASAAASRPVALSSEDKAVLDALAGYLDGVEGLIGGSNTGLAAILTTLANATPAGENHIGAVGGHSAVAGGTFNRPADTTAYAIGDLVANNTTAGSVTPLSCGLARVNAGTGIIRRARLSTTKTGLAGTEVFRVHLFKSSPTVTNGDNGAFSVNGVASLALGSLDVTMASVYNDGAKGFTAADIVFDAGAGVTTIFALIEARSAYTPASGETFALALEVLRD